MPKRLHTYIAFLRAINVGGHTVKMERLREIFESLDFTSVSTFIASGNVIFEATSSDVDALEARIEAALKMALGYDVETFIRTPSEVAAIVDHIPFPAEAGKADTLSVALMKAPASAEAAARLAELRDDRNELVFHGREMYWLTRGRMSDSGITPRMFDRVAAGSATSRNITTLRKLAARFPVS